MKRWVIKSNDGLEVVTTGGNEPAGALCECKNEWTIYNISYDAINKVVIYDPEKENRKKIEDERKARAKKMEDIKVEFIEQFDTAWDYIAQRRNIVLAFVIGAIVGMVSAQLVSLP